MYVTHLNKLYSNQNTDPLVDLRYVKQKPRNVPCDYFFHFDKNKS